MSMWTPGQRWLSETEPELGLGSLLSASERDIRVFFPVAGEARQYATDTAPLRRARFAAGDWIRTHEGQTCRVHTVRDEQGLLIYETTAGSIPETDLCDTLTINTPLARLQAGHFEELARFPLRLAVLECLNRTRQAPGFGFQGCRVELLPHQLSIAGDAVSTPGLPRLLLADEVGLGKTVEACLIMHRLLLSGRASRVLAIVPEPLIHQWLVELLRRFNHWFRMVVEPTAQTPDAAPFEDSQLVLTTLDALVHGHELGGQARRAAWDLLIVDEAHHLKWAPGKPSPEYRLVEQLATSTPGVLLLTATPEQLGEEQHFARLRLLDPERYHSLEVFLRDRGRYRRVAALANCLLEGRTLDAADRTLLRNAVGEKHPDLSTESGRQAVVADLVDRYGTGRAMVRNTRATVPRFPKRILEQVVLPEPEDGALRLDLLAEFEGWATGNRDVRRPHVENDPRVPWLAALLNRHAPEKVVLICHSAARAVALAEALREYVDVGTALFHEQLPLIQRDRNAAWFADEDGARILLCSEIGSEGRNFQFAHHLVLMDLPYDPEVLEQRIGRLDRIGQRSAVRIHVPVIEHTPGHLLARWLHEGVNAFEGVVPSGVGYAAQFLPRILDILRRPPDEHADLIEALIRDTAAYREETERRLREGRDRLLELNSFHPQRAQRLIDDIRRLDADSDLHRTAFALLDHIGVDISDGPGRSRVLRGNELISGPGTVIPESGLTVTVHRDTALAREDTVFLSWDHSIITNAAEHVLSTGQGNCTVAYWPRQDRKEVLLETIFIVDVPAPSGLHVDRFLAPRPIRLVVDQDLRDRTSSLPCPLPHEQLIDGRRLPVFGNTVLTRNLVPVMLDHAKTLAQAQADEIASTALQHMTASTQHELSRLRTLATINPGVTDQQIRELERHAQALADYLANPRLRLDAIRVIWRSPKPPTG